MHGSGQYLHGRETQLAKAARKENRDLIVTTRQLAVLFRLTRAASRVAGHTNTNAKLDWVRLPPVTSWNARLIELGPDPKSTVTVTAYSPLPRSLMSTSRRMVPL